MIGAVLARARAARLRDLSVPLVPATFLDLAYREGGSCGSNQRGSGQLASSPLDGAHGLPDHLRLDGALVHGLARAHNPVVEYVVPEGRTLLGGAIAMLLRFLAPFVVRVRRVGAVFQGLPSKTLPLACCAGLCYRWDVLSGDGIRLLRLVVVDLSEGRSGRDEEDGEKELAHGVGLGLFYAAVRGKVTGGMDWSTRT